MMNRNVMNVHTDTWIKSKDANVVLFWETYDIIQTPIFNDVGGELSLAIENKLLDILGELKFE